IEKYRDSSLDFLGRVRLWFRILGNQAIVYFGKDSSQARKIAIAKMKWELALASAKRRESSNLDTEDLMYRFQGRRKDGIEVYETSENIKKKPYKERRKAFLDIMKNEYRGRTARFIKNGKKYYATFDEDDVQKNIYGDKKSDSKGYDAKLNIGADGDIFELVENSKYVKSEDERGKGQKSHNDIVDWDYYEKTVQIDDVVFDVYINVRNKTSDSYVYSIHLRENTKVKAASPHRSTKKVSVKSGDDHLYSISIPQEGENSNKNISFSAKTSDEPQKRKRRSVEDIEAELDEIAKKLDSPDITLSEEDELLDRQLKLEAKLRARKRMREREIRDIDMASAKRSAGDDMDGVSGGLPEAQLKKYRETGDSSHLPTKATARMSLKHYEDNAAGYAKEISQIENILHALRAVRAGIKNIELATDEEIELAKSMTSDDELELHKRLDELRKKFSEALYKGQITEEIIEELKKVDTIARPNHTWVNDISVELSDKQNIITDGLYKTNDVERNFRNFFGKYFKTAYEKVLKPFYDSKKNYAEGVEEYAKRLREEIVDSLKIKAGSRESAAVMWLGEGKKPISKKAGAELASYTYEDCVKEFGEKRAADIKKASEIFRKTYDELLDKVNETRAKIYPNNPDKLVARRDDYFHHFQEMGQGFAGLRNILNTNIGIDPMLVGTSEHTKPKSKWQGYMQRRLGERTEYDAVLGFLKYLPAAQYSIHIDPNIVNFRSLAYDLASAKALENKGEGNPNANVFIEYLQKYANSLAGKTVSHGDRGFISYVGRTSLAVISWLNNMTKASAVLGNVNSVLSQVTNVKNMIGKISHQDDALRGALEALAGINPKSEIASRYNESGFLKERFLQDSLDDYSVAKWNFKKVMQTPGHFAAWMLGFADEIGTRITWNAAYNEAIRKNIKDAAQYADSFTRQCVASRGIGEEPLVFKSQMAKLFLPFRTEVLNDLRVQQDILFGKEYDIWEKNGGKNADNKENYVDLSFDNELISQVEGMRGAEKYKVIRDFILEQLGDKDIVFSDGLIAKVDRSDASHIASSAATKKTA
ncbi:MAG: hypothetical protein IJB50_01280, partial [Clostridia bacterium]|nr:hypothetical protein [Clostridia bacterium]